MFLTAVSKYSQIAKTNLKHNLARPLALALLLLFLAPILFGIRSLDETAAAIPLEMFVALIGIVLLTPIFTPEQDPEIRDLMETKDTSPTGICLIRLILATSCVLILIYGFAVIMTSYGSIFPLAQYVIGTFATAFFLGSLGLFCYVIFNQIAIGYMIPFGYYAFNMMSGSGNLGNFYLFSMSQASFEEKYWLIGSSVLLIGVILIIKKVVRKTR